MNLTYTGSRHPITGDEHCVNENGREYWDRHGVIGSSVGQLDAIAALRDAISVGWEHIPSTASVQGPRVFSAASLPNEFGSVIVGAWNGSLGWIVRRDGSVSRSSKRYETDGDYNLIEVS